MFFLTSVPPTSRLYPLENHALLASFLPRSRIATLLSAASSSTLGLSRIVSPSQMSRRCARRRHAVVGAKRPCLLTLLDLDSCRRPPLFDVLRIFSRWHPNNDAMRDCRRIVAMGSPHRLPSLLCCQSANGPLLRASPEVRAIASIPWVPGTRRHEQSCRRSSQFRHCRHPLGGQALEEVGGPESLRRHLAVARMVPTKSRTRSAPPPSTPPLASPWRLLQMSYTLTSCTSMW